MPWRGRFAVAVSLLTVSGCSGGFSGLGLLGENFPPHDIAFVNYAAPEFPFRLRATPIGEGYAILVVTVDHTGRPEDLVVVEASHTDFAAALLEVAPEWLFLPAEADSDPRREVIQFQFRRSGVATSMSHREAARAPFDAVEDRQPAVRMVSAAEYMPERVDLDTLSDLSVAAAGTSGTADVSFVIDQDGRVRVPVVVRSPNLMLTDAALAVVDQWRYVPPSIDGKPVLVEVSRTVTFSAPDR